MPRHDKPPKDVKIEVHPKDDVGPSADFCYCAIAMGYDGNDWYNTGVVVRDPSPTAAFNRVLAMVARKGWWD
jgi:hypothetical protein